MKGITVIFLATLLYTGDPQKTENLYSWQITFQSYDQCKLFYNEYQADILNGLLDHGTKKFGKIEVDYLACAEVELDFNKKHPKVLSQIEMYKKGG